MAGRSGYPKSSGRVFRVLKNRTRNSLTKIRTRQFGYPKISGSGSGYPNYPNHILSNMPPLELDAILCVCGQAFAGAPPTLLACGGEGAPELDRRRRR